MDISLHALRYFCALADHLHYGRAASAVGISPPSLSAQITRLESALDARLFERSPRHVTLTEAGAELLPLARELLTKHDDVLRWAGSRRRHTLRGRLSVGIVVSGGPVTAILQETVRMLPEVALEIRRLGFFEEIDAIIDGRVDVAFAPGPLTADDRVRTSAVWSEPRVLVVPRDHRLADRAWVDIADTAEETFLTAAGSQSNVIDWWIVDPRPDGTHPRRGRVAEDIDTLFELCAAGAGVNIAAASAATHYRRADLSVIPIRDIEPSTVYLCGPAQTRNPAIAMFQEIVRSVATDGAFPG